MEINSKLSILNLNNLLTILNNSIIIITKYRLLSKYFTYLLNLPNNGGVIHEKNRY